MIRWQRFWNPHCLGKKLISITKKIFNMLDLNLNLNHQRVKPCLFLRCLPTLIFIECFIDRWPHDRYKEYLLLHLWWVLRKHWALIYFATKCKDLPIFVSRYWVQLLLEATTNAGSYLEDAIALKGVVKRWENKIKQVFNVKT